MVAAAGNFFQDGNPAIYPADYPHVVTVAALDRANRPARFSSSSPAVDLAAPGESIPAQDPGDPSSFALFTGTSYAAPIVSAAAAWLWTARSSLDVTELHELLRRSARDVGARGADRRTGFGLLDIPALLEAAPPGPDPQEPNDDIDLVVAGGVFESGKPLLTGPARGRAELTARIDAAEDPGDVYRVFIPAGRTIEITVSPQANVGLTLWHPRTKTVLARRAAARRNRLAASHRPGSATERIVYRNTTGRAMAAYVSIRPAGGPGTVGASYVLRVRTR